MDRQNTDTILMVEPVNFHFNKQTAGNNYFQQSDNNPELFIQEQALSEFNRMVSELKSRGVKVINVKDTVEPHTPDSIFPNNWITSHDDGRIVLYPMYAENRRQERKNHVLQKIEQSGFIINYTVDYTSYEKEDIFLEGTGSMVLNRSDRVAYAALSERTDKNLFLEFCKELGYTPVFFTANQTVDGKRLPIYHTNVMMNIGDRYVIVCLDSVDDLGERKQLIDSFNKSNKEIIEISEDQVAQFTGNMLQVENNRDEKFLVMSQSAYESLLPEQIEKLTSYNEIVCIPVPTIEKYGGGSVRCMIAEIFLPKIK